MQIQILINLLKQAGIEYKSKHYNAAKLEVAYFFSYKTVYGETVFTVYTDNHGNIIDKSDEM